MGTSVRGKEEGEEQSQGRTFRLEEGKRVDSSEQRRPNPPEQGGCRLRKRKTKRVPVHQSERKNARSGDAFFFLELEERSVVLPETERKKSEEQEELPKKGRKERDPKER